MTMSDNFVHSQEALDLLPYPVFGLASDFSFLYLNYASEGFFQRSRSLLKKGNLRDFFLSDSPIFALLRRVAGGLSSVGDQEVTLISHKIGKKLVNIQIASFPDQSGYIVSLQQREIADQLRGQSLFRGAALSMSKMTSLLAHEIKNPLAGIKGAAQLIELEADQQTAELSQLIVGEADRIANLLTRIETMTGAGKLAAEEVNIHEVLQHAINVTAASFGRHMTIERRFDPSLPPVMADRELLIQCFINLLKNACEASNDEGYLEIATSYALQNITSASAQSREKYLPLQIDIIDQGSGIPAALKDILFEPFISDKAEGSGLGLALVASVIADHQGIIAVESHPGRTHFQILLPLHQEADK